MSILTSNYICDEHCLGEAEATQQAIPILTSNFICDVHRLNSGLHSGQATGGLWMPVRIRWPSMLMPHIWGFVGDWSSNFGKNGIDVEASMVIGRPTLGRTGLM
jgi:hypothetical protein